MRVLAAVLFALLASQARPLFAHAVLVDAQPAAGAALAVAPAGVVLRFNEPVMAVALRVLDSGARNVALAHVGAGDTVRADLPAQGLPPGRYLVSYRVLSADSHPVAASLEFTIGDARAAGVSNTAAVEIEVAWRAPQVANRALHLIALALAAGGALFELFVGSPRGEHRQFVLAACLIGVLTALLSIGLEGAAAANAAHGEWLQPEIWRLGLASSRGTASLTAAGGLLSIAVAGVVSRGHWRGVMLFAGVALVLSAFVLSGHGATASPVLFAVPMWVLHTGVAMLWVGSLPQLLFALQRGPDAGGAARRFSSLAVVAVPLLLGAGFCMAVLEGGPMLAFADSRYASVLGIKLLLVTVLLGIAIYNRLALLPRLDAGVPGARQRLAWSIRVELAIALCVLGLAATLSHEVPPRVTASGNPAANEARELSLRSNTGIGLRIDVGSASPASRSVRLQFLDPAGLPFQPKEVTLEIANPELGIEPLARQLESLGGGVYRLGGEALPVEGRWRVRIEALLSDFERAEFDAEITTRAGAMSVSAGSPSRTSGRESGN